MKKRKVVGKTRKYSADLEGSPGTYKLREGTTQGGRKYDAYKDSTGRTRVTVKGRGTGGPTFVKQRVKTSQGDVVEKTQQKWGETPQKIEKGPTKEVGMSRGKGRSGPKPLKKVMK